MTDQIGALLDRFELINLELKQEESEVGDTTVTIQEVFRTQPRKFQNAKYPCIYMEYTGFGQEFDAGGVITRPYAFNLYFLRHPVGRDKITDELVSAMTESVTLWAGKILNHYHLRRYMQTLEALINPATAIQRPLGFVRDPITMLNTGGASGAVIPPNGEEYFGTVFQFTVQAISSYKRI